jgi:excisionase family DNA binding protein
VTSELPLDLQDSEASGEPRLGRSVSIDQAAQLLNVSRRTIYNRIRDGRLQTIRTLGGSQRVLIESLHDLGFRPQAFSASAAAASFTVRPSTRS